MNVTQSKKYEFKITREAFMSYFWWVRELETGKRCKGGYTMTCWGARREVAKAVYNARHLENKKYPKVLYEGEL